MVPITISRLEKRFGKTVAVDKIDLVIPEGSLFFLLGPSGCGKTTLLRMIAGFTEPTAGEIRFGDKDVTYLAPEKRNCGMVFQSYALWPHMTVAQNVAFGLEVRGFSKDVIKKKVGEALEQVRMSHRATHKPNELSGGQQQRVALARAMVIEPSVLLLDEPLSNLDAKLRLEMRSQIREICKAAKITAVYVTHDQKEALSMADGMAVLLDGRLIQTGDPRTLYDKPISRFVADFLGETNFIGGTAAHPQDGQGVFTTHAGIVRADTVPPSIKKDDKVTLSVRPEAVSVLTKSQAHARPELNQIPVKRVESIYLGEVAQHTLDAGQGVKIKALELNPRLHGAAEGEELAACFHPRDVVALAE
jgi:iron(III) transport system ATP-binding protein